MTVRYKSLVLCLAISLNACSPTDLGGGYEIIDGGGTKRSLAKDGLVLINYTVTGWGRAKGFVIIENRPYGATECEYYVLDSNEEGLIKVLSNKTQTSQISLPEAIESVKSLTYHSCKSLPRPGVA